MIVQLEELVTYTSSKVLAIKSYADIFPPNEDGVERVSRKMFSLWHPDKRGPLDQKQATEVFSHVKALADAARERIAAGVWGAGFLKTFESKTHKFPLLYLREEPIEGFGIQYISRGRVSYLIPDSNLDLLEIWKENLARLKAAAVKVDMIADMHLKIATQLDIGERKLGDDSVLMFITKDENFLCLKHVLEKGPLDSKQVAWIITRLCRLACVMKIADVPNLDLSSRSVFINPKTHGVMMFDGWQFAKRFEHVPTPSKKEKNLYALPGRTQRLCPSLTENGNVGLQHVGHLIKILARECLGDASGARLMANKDIPKPMTRWLLTPAAFDPINELKLWDMSRKESFGPDVWTPTILSEADVYG